MNKKIFTLAAVLGLASVASTSVLAADLTAGQRDVTKFEVGKVYQLGDATAAKVLVMVSDGANGYTLKLKEVTSVTDLKSTLWKVTPSFDNSATGPDFSFVNEATGMPLTVDPSKAHVYEATKTYQAADGQVKMSGSTSAWKWKSVTETAPTSKFGTSGLLSYFKKDSVVTLVTGATATANATGNGYTASEDVYLVKTTASRDKWEGRHLRLAPITAGAVTLSAYDLNTKMLTDLNSTSFKLSSDKTTSENSKLGNVFRDKTFRAWNMGDANWPGAAAANTAKFIQYVSDPLKVGASNSAGDADHVFLQVIDKDVNEDNPFKDTYLLADTAYIDGTANNLALVKFGTDSIVSAVSAGNGFLDKAKAGRDIKSYMFKFTYYPTSDSIAISVKSYNKMTTTTSDVNGKDTKWATATTNLNVVTLNKLTEVTEITLTAANPAANVRFYLGTGNDNRSSEKNGLYYIKNAKGQFLAVPINEAGYDDAKWVTVKGGEQAVAHMPAYQWVVLKNNEATTTLAGISSLAIANREFPDVKAGAVQLYQNEGAANKFAVAKDLFAATDSVSFDQIEDKAVLNDATLGYLDLDDKVLDVMTYKLNYLHPYATNKFIGMDKDSLLSVKDAETAFFMKESAKANYGYIVTTAVANKITDLKQLTRVKYTPYVKTAGGDLYIAMNDESRYYLTPKASEKETFYLKENNHYQPEGATEARHYYALVDLNSATDSTKVGTTDDDMAAILKNQVLHETRTSAFAVLPYDAPLYRRFNTALEGVASDVADTLKFKEYYRGEYLMDENNKKFQNNSSVNYLGIERADKATGLSFIVDTAIVKATTFGEIKPQYFIYVNPEKKGAEASIPCDATNHQHIGFDGLPTVADSCVHATPAKAGFTKAKYLVSFADSLNAKDADKLYKFGKYTRVGFVDGLHIGDSLYILVNGFEKKALADLDTAAIKAAYKAAKITDKIIDLKADRTDAHHNYTWSFRFINPEKAASATEETKDVAFLIESNKGDLDIAPTKGAWLKSQNGCLVLSDATEATFENAKTGGDNALIFNIEVGSKEDLATDNETIEASSVSVIASEGQITVAGAEGKKVVISNILGQVIANTVISSSNATIAVPAGVVVVAIEGEAAVKAIVK